MTLTRPRCLALGAGIALTLLLRLPAGAGAQLPAYATEPLTFMSGTLRIATVLGRPRGEGTHPAYVQNHGSMTAAQANGPRWTSIAGGSLSDVLARRGYVVLVVARRGYRGSQGTTLSYSADATSRIVRSARDVILSAQAKADDVVAAVDHLRTLPYVDGERITVGGVSPGRARQHHRGRAGAPDQGRREHGRRLPPDWRQPW